MAKVYNQIGSFTVVKSHLENNNVRDFKSLKGLISFQNDYARLKKEVMSETKTLIEQEKILLKSQIEELHALVEEKKQQEREQLQSELNKLKEDLNKSRQQATGIIKSIARFFYQSRTKRKIEIIEHTFESKISDSVQPQINSLNNLDRRYQFIISNTEEALKERSTLLLSELEFKKRVIDEINTFIYGAIGELRVSNLLQTLSDDYALINDFKLNFVPPLYFSKEKKTIRQIQIDHVLIGPSGIFLLETKNWSGHSINSEDFRSPVEQIKCANYSIFKLLEHEIENLLKNHHWGDRKIPQRNLIVLMDQKPKEEFQYVKILTLSELRNYVEYFKPCLSNFEVQVITDYFLRINYKTVSV